MMTPIGAMRIAIQEAQKGLGFVAPNPAVGCVILDKNNNLVAKGYHQAFGGPHAEIDALKNVFDPEQLKGATVYVTLEPCSHVGKTGSCAQHLAKLPISKVVYGLEDPYHEVRGRGVAILKAAGIQVEKFDQLNDELEDLTEVFLFNHRNHKTFVALKVATSLDGQMAHITGDSKWITGEQSREHVHFLRAQYDAVLVGKNTFLKDDPNLNIRHPKFIGKKNKVVILESNGEVTSEILKSNVLKSHRAEDILIATADPRLKAPAGIQVIYCAKDKRGLVDLKDLLSRLYAINIGSVFVEGGATVISEFLNLNLVQRYYQFIAPTIIGSESGLSFTKNVRIANLNEKMRLGNVKTTTYGADILVSGRCLD